MAKLTIEVDLVAIESVSDLKKFHNGLSAFIKALDDEASKALPKVFPAGGPPPLPIAEPNDPQIAKAEDVVKPLVEAAKVLEPSPVEQKAPAPVTPTIPKAVMPSIPKAVMPNIPKATAPAATTTVAPALAKAIQATAAVNAATSAEPSVTIKDLRDLMATKVTKHVEVLRNKLAEYGSANVSNLNPQYYDEFYEFLNSLPNE